MRRVRFGPGFAAVMAVGFASSFVIPPRFTTPVRGPLLGAFAPVSVPIQWVAGAFYRRLHPAVVDPVSPARAREAGGVYDENLRLRGALAALQVKYEQLARVDADRQAVGDIRPLCRPVTVGGYDASGLRDVLLVVGPNVPGKRPVVCGTDLVGRTAAGGLTGAEVQLVTDAKFAVTARIGRYATDDAGRVRLQLADHPPVLVQGLGHGTMAIRSTLTVREVADLNVREGDVVVLDDHDWSPNLQGFTVGRVAGVTPQRNAPLFADVRVQPQLDLKALSERAGEVMVVVRD